jgi:mannose-1-phosphate guanylyltransferase
MFGSVSRGSDSDVDILQFAGQSLFQQTVRRNQVLSGDFFIVSNCEQYFLAVNQLGEVAAANPRSLLKPEGALYTKATWLCKAKSKSWKKKN